MSTHPGLAADLALQRHIPAREADHALAPRPNAWNFSISPPDEFPTFTTLSASCRSGMAITHSPVAGGNAVAAAMVRVGSRQQIAGTIAVAALIGWLMGADPRPYEPACRT